MKQMRNLMIIVLLGAGSLVLATGLATNAASADNDVLSSQDKSFLNNAAEGGLAEVELGKMAADKGTNQSVKDFGRKMIEDHSRANDHLKAIADKFGASVPDHVSATQFAVKTKLSAYSGSHFDRAYMDTMVKDHRDDIAAFRREAQNGRNPEVKAFASKTLPTLEEHLRMAEKANREVGGEAANH